MGFSAVKAAELPVTSSFGWRIHPVTGEYKFHAGVDLGYDEGTPIPAMFEGQVLIYHAVNDTYTRYAHCSVLYVQAGDYVGAGDCIALVGNTGNSTGPHLHLEYIVRDAYGEYTYTDPLILWGY